MPPALRLRIVPVRAFLPPALLLVLFLVCAPRARAHNMPGSGVALDFCPDGVAAELTLPLVELELAFKQPLLSAPTEILPSHEADLRAYLLRHIQPVSPSGKPWTVEIRSLALRLQTEPKDLVAQVWMEPPSGESARRFAFNYDVIGHEVNNHYTLVSIRSDWNTAVFEQPEPVGILQYTVKSLEIDRNRGSWWTGFRSVLKTGIQHIAEGTDHLLFLLVLLLPAPLVAVGRRWSSQGGLMRRSLREVFKIVTAFTLGHSLTLVIGALGWVRLPAQPVEILIAVSILVSAVHAARPCFAGREMVIAASFGLVHGLAFAGSLAGFGFSVWHRALGILAFNLGIELMQLAVVAATLPSLLLLARTRFYPAFRLAGACFAGVAALGWLLERASGRANVVGGWLASATRHAAPAAVVLLALALLAFWSERRRTRPPAASRV